MRVKRFRAVRMQYFNISAEAAIPAGTQGCCNITVRGRVNRRTTTVANIDAISIVDDTPIKAGRRNFEVFTEVLKIGKALSDTSYAGSERSPNATLGHCQRRMGQNHLAVRDN